MQAVAPDTLLSFPSEDGLLSAIRGHHVGEHRLCQLARDLGRLHDQLRRSPRNLELRCTRCELIDAIDVWVAHRLPRPHPQARLHTEGMGAVIDRVAAAQVRAWDLVLTADLTEPEVHAAWYRLAELVDGYTDLTTEVLARSRRLPTVGDLR
ncbi:DUF4254 domain-containing protein [Nocardia sp. XZ_19_385]|uniref:DUF4254 domain-containing protein n=1 Tax=Nocardia sp. XZ_19_385 TaxID=2769488 RepID=UPI00188EBC83|nr:DUF4254 domain-containing protein [Nocardia sp. XZ_19_385]